MVIDLPNLQETAGETPQYPHGGAGMANDTRKHTVGTSGNSHKS